MQSMELYSKAAVERAIKVQEVILRGGGQEDHLVAGGGDHRHQRSADAALSGALRAVGLALRRSYDILLGPRRASLTNVRSS